MSAAPSIRLARPGDEHALATINVHAWHAAYRGLMPEGVFDVLSIPGREAQFAETLRATPSEQRTWVLEEDGRILGYAATGPTRDEGATPATMELWSLYFEPEAWGRGLGRALHTHALEDLRTRGFASVTLWVLTSNARARRFYEAAGFTVDVEEEIKVWRGFELPHTRYVRAL